MAISSYLSVVSRLASKDVVDGKISSVTLDRLVNFFQPAFEAKGRVSTNPTMDPIDLSNVFAIANLLISLGAKSEDEISEIKQNAETFDLETYSPAICVPLDESFDFVIKYGREQTIAFDPRDRTVRILRRKDKTPYSCVVDFSCGGFAGWLPVRLRKMEADESVRFFASIDKGKNTLESIKYQVNYDRLPIFYDSSLPIGTELWIEGFAPTAKPISGTNKSIPQYALFRKDGTSITLDVSCFGQASRSQIQMIGIPDDSGIERQSIIKVGIVPQKDKDGNPKLRNDGEPWMKSQWVAPASDDHRRQILEQIRKAK